MKISDLNAFESIIIRNLFEKVENPFHFTKEEKDKNASHIKDEKPIITGKFLRHLVLELEYEDENRKFSTIRLPKTGLNLEGFIIEGFVDISHSLGTRNRTLHPLQFENCIFEKLKNKDTSDEKSKKPKACFDGRYCHFSELTFKKCQIEFIDVSYSQFKSSVRFEEIQPIKSEKNKDTYEINPTPQKIDWEQLGTCRIKAKSIKSNNDFTIFNSILNLKNDYIDQIQNCRKDGEPDIFALLLTGAKIDGDLFLRKNHIMNGLSIASTIIQGDIWMDGSKVFGNEKNNAIWGQSAEIKGILGIGHLHNIYHKKEDSIKTTKKDYHAVITGIVDFLNAKIGYVFISGASFKKESLKESYLAFRECEIGRVLIENHTLKDDKKINVTSEYEFHFRNCLIIKNFEIVHLEFNSTIDRDKRLFLNGTRFRNDLKLKDIICYGINLEGISLRGNLECKYSSRDEKDFSLEFLFGNQIQVEGNILFENFECKELNLENAKTSGNLEIQSSISKLKTKQIQVQGECFN